jgi:hypothetical protein
LHGGVLSILLIMIIPVRGKKGVADCNPLLSLFSAILIKQGVMFYQAVTGTPVSRLFFR